MRKHLLFTLLIFLFEYSLVFPAAPSSKPYVILISFDGFRWDYPFRGLSPNLEKLAQTGTSAISLRPVFPSKTFPNHYSIITGLYPENHGIIQNNFINPFTSERYRVGDTVSVRDHRWYRGEALWETAERQGVISASYFWPGSEITLAGCRPTYVKNYDDRIPYHQRVEGVLQWLTYPPASRPHFITLYFDATDTAGHTHGPDSEQINQAITVLDQTLGMLIQGLNSLQLLDSTNIIVLSDHGMMAVDHSRLITVTDIIGPARISVQGSGPFLLIDAPPDELPSIYKNLKAAENHYQVYLKTDMPVFYHFSHYPFIPPVIVVAEPGWSLEPPGGEGGSDYLVDGGNHGYDPNYLDMHGIFCAMGPAFRKGYRTGTLWNIDIYPLICRILGIEPHRPIDGCLERIEFILEKKNIPD